ncbi:hypothetical protein B0H13DRAFT_1005802 [Mycena leptocephala]|nr:hypothetical protein B0H13DRAFT_1005802 [Mycena leptocephala]
MPLTLILFLLLNCSEGKSCWLSIICRDKIRIRILRKSNRCTMSVRKKSRRSKSALWMGRLGRNTARVLHRFATSLSLNSSVMGAPSPVPVDVPLLEADFERRMLRFDSYRLI